MKKASWFFWAFVGLGWLFMSLPFTDYSLPFLFDIPDRPPRSHEGLRKLMQNITYTANCAMLSILVLYGLNRGWHLVEGYPKVLRGVIYRRDSRSYLRTSAFVLVRT